VSWEAKKPIPVCVTGQYLEEGDYDWGLPDDHKYTILKSITTFLQLEELRKEHH